MAQYYVCSWGPDQPAKAYLAVITLIRMLKFTKSGEITMPQPPNNPFDSFRWLKDFISAVPRIIGKNSNPGAFQCSCYVTQPTSINNYTMRAARSDATGNYTIGLYWLGFYYKLWQNNPMSIAIPWFGCQFSDEFTIDIIVHPNITLGGAHPNQNLSQYLLNNEYAGYNGPLMIHGTPQKPFSCQANSRPNILLRYRFDDYMKYKKGNPAFDLESWIHSCNNQENDLADFFEDVNANHLAPNI